MKTFIEFLKEDVSAEFYDLLEPHDEFSPNTKSSEEHYNKIEFEDFAHYMKTQIETVSNYISSQGITDQNQIKKALNDAFLKPEVQRAFRLHYARKFPNKVTER